MLGRGRPFIVEVKRPKKRFLDLSQLRGKVDEEAAGKVRVSKLRFVDRDMVRKLKEMEGCEKLYRVTVEFDREVPDQELDNVERTFKDLTIQQQTPRRVIHRRADLTREKYIYETRVKRLAKNQAEIRIRCQGGLYIKELVTGDEGRTKPNICEVTKAKTTPLQLDVLNVYTKNRRFIKK
jgi:tRNA pseudouridine synthase 10